MKNWLKHASLFLMVVSLAVFIKYSDVRPVYEENPEYAVGIALLGFLVHWMDDDDC